MATAWLWHPRHGLAKWARVARYCADGRRGPEVTQRGAMKIKPGPNYTAHYSVLCLSESCMPSVCLNGRMKHLSDKNYDASGVGV